MLASLSTWKPPIFCTVFVGFFTALLAQWRQKKVRQKRTEQQDTRTGPSRRRTSPEQESRGGEVRGGMSVDAEVDAYSAGRADVPTTLFV